MLTKEQLLVIGEENGSISRQSNSNKNSSSSDNKSDISSNHSSSIGSALTSLQIDGNVNNTSALSLTTTIKQPLSPPLLLTTASTTKPSPAPALGVVSSTCSTKVAPPAQSGLRISNSSNNNTTTAVKASITALATTSAITQQQVWHIFDPSYQIISQCRYSIISMIKKQLYYYILYTTLYI